MPKLRPAAHVLMTRAAWGLGAVAQYKEREHREVCAGSCGLHKGHCYVRAPYALSTEIPKRDPQIRIECTALSTEPWSG